MKYAVDMGSGAMIQTSSLIKIGLAIQKLIGGGGGYTDTHTEHDDHISLLFFFKTRKGG
jgi:hypothetical protein